MPLSSPSARHGSIPSRILPEKGRGLKRNMAWAARNRAEIVPGAPSPPAIVPIAPKAARSPIPMKCSLDRAPDHCSHNSVLVSSSRGARCRTKVSRCGELRCGKGASIRPAERIEVARLPDRPGTASARWHYDRGCADPGLGSVALPSAFPPGVAGNKPSLEKGAESDVSKRSHHYRPARGRPSGRSAAASAERVRSTRRLRGVADTPGRRSKRRRDRDTPANRAKGPRVLEPGNAEGVWRR